MLNYFCFHVYAQKSLFIGENGNDFFWTSSSSAPDPVSLQVIELVPSFCQTHLAFFQMLAFLNKEKIKSEPKNVFKA